MKKDIELLKYKLEGLQEINMRMLELCEPNSEEQYHLDGSLEAIDKVLEIVDDLDEEPYSIQKLIHDYEYKTGTFDWATAFQSTIHGENDFITDVNQLDEPEVLSQEWVDENKSSWTKLKIDGYYIQVEKLQNLLVPKRELPVVPKHVGEWITKHREKYDLYPALKELEESVWGWERTYKWYRMNTHKFVNAYLTGEYEVEEEPKYHALIKGYELVNGYDVYWNCDKSDCSVFVSRLHPPHDDFITEMTEQEWFEIGVTDSIAHFVEVGK